MRSNHVKAQLKRGEPTLGAWLSLPSSASARMMARLGFDWLLIDMEHSAQHPALMAEMVGAIADAGTSAPLVRIPSNSVEWFTWALDAGAWGIIVPMVNSRQEAQRAVSCCKYPPVGTRSIGGAFAPYGFGSCDQRHYRQVANDEIMIIVQIESVQALQHLDDILSVPAIDVAFVGPNDLHAQLGLTPSSDGAEPAFVEALHQIQATASKYHLALGIFSSNGTTSAERIGQGFQMVSVTSDLGSMAESATHHLRRARREL